MFFIFFFPFFPLWGIIGNRSVFSVEARSVNGPVENDEFIIIIILYRTSGIERERDERVRMQFCWYRSETITRGNKGDGVREGENHKMMSYRIR